jgi:hypothetical protein
MYRALPYFLISFISATCYAACGEPQPRMVCAEYFRSEAVVAAKVMRITHTTPKHEMDFYVYELQTQTTIRGKIQKSFRIWEENGSARPGFDWRRGRSYLLFLRYMKDRDAWDLDGCGNSMPLTEATAILRKIEAIQTTHGSPQSGLIQGTVDGLEGVRVLVAGSGRQYEQTTNKYGGFRIHVPPGQYKLSFEKPDWSFERNLFSYEDPDNVRIENRSCAQVSIDPKQNRKLK